MTQPTPPADGHDSQTDAVNTVLVVIDGPLDKTRRPRRPSIPYTPPDPPAPGPDEGKEQTGDTSAPDA